MGYLTSIRSVWQPLRGPLSDWPLALCLKNDGSDETHHKTEAVDVVFPDRVQDVELAYYSKEQNWVYLSNQVPEECLLFLQGEVSLQGGKTREGKSDLPHFSHFYNPCSCKQESRMPALKTRIVEVTNPHEKVSRSSYLFRTKNKRLRKAQCQLRESIKTYTNCNQVTFTKARFWSKLYRWNKLHPAAP